MPVTCGDRTLLLQPRQVAAALRASLDESRLGTPHYWDVAATEHGEWWALRARYPMPPGRETAAGPAETCITVQCAVDGTRLLLQPACRLPQSGAEIQSSEYDVTIDDLRVRLPHNPGFDLLTAVADEVDATADLLASLRTEAVSRRMLVAWASAMVKPAMGHTMATTLIALYDQRRFSTSLPDRNRPDPVDTGARHRLDARAPDVRRPQHRRAYRIAVRDHPHGLRAGALDQTAGRGRPRPRARPDRPRPLTVHRPSTDRRPPTRRAVHSRPSKRKRPMHTAHRSRQSAPSNATCTRGLHQRPHGRSAAAAEANGNVGTPQTLVPRRTERPTRGWLLAERPPLHGLQRTAA